MPVAIVTGASRGLGRAIARDLATRGWGLVIDARGNDALDTMTAELANDPQAVAIAGDITDSEHREALVAAAARLGSVDLLVNNASALGPSPQPRLDAYPLGVLREVYETNVVAPLALVQLALPFLRTSSIGTIVNITSDASVEAYDGWGGYGSSKAALDQLGNILGAEEPDVRVFTFDPGDMRTQMHQDAFPGDDISDRPEPESVVPALRRLLDERPPSGRYRASAFLVVSP